MNNGDVPFKFPIPFGASAGAGFIRNIPQASQIGVHDGWASLTDGFPPLCFDPVEAGGVPPFGQDFNGILKLLSQWSQWAAAGGPLVYDSAFATAIGGYPKGALIMSATLDFLWLNLLDGNTANPDTGGANWVQATRIRLSANTTFYVSPTGNNANSGRTVGAPWATLQHAWDFLKQYVDLNGWTVTIQCANGTYSAGISGAGALVGQAGASSVLFRGDSATPANVTMSVASAICFASLFSGSFTVDGFKLTGTGLSFGIVANEGGQIVYQNMDFGAFPSGYHVAGTGASVILCNGNYTISGGAISHISMTGGAVLRWPGVAAGQTITLTGTPAFSGAFYSGQGCASSVGPFTSNTTFSGAATGKRFDLQFNATVNTSGAGLTYFPGNAAGTTGTGGQYG